MRGHIKIRPAIEARVALFLWSYIPPPDQVTGVEIARIKIAGLVQIVATHTDNQLVFDDRGRNRTVVNKFSRAVRLEPFLLTRLGLERDQVAIGRDEVERVVIDRGPSVADMDAAAIARPDVMPQLMSGSRIHGVGIVGRRVKKRAIYEQRCALHVSAKSSASATSDAHGAGPSKRQALNVLIVYFRESAETLARVVPVVYRPRIGRRVKNHLVAKVDCRRLGVQGRQNSSERQKGDNRNPSLLHFKLHKYAVRSCI